MKVSEEKKDLEEQMEEDTVSEAVASEEESPAEETGQAEENPAEDVSEASEPKKEEKKRSGRRKDKNAEKLEKMEEKLADLEDKRMRQLAEFENFRKRSEREKSQMFEVGAKTVVEKMLPVIDNFERGLLGVPEEEKDTPFVQGVELVYKQLITALDELGVKPIEAVGEVFDPNLHNAVMMVDDDTLESGTIAEEMQKGYLYRESVVRHSMVKVVN